MTEGRKQGLSAAIPNAIGSILGSGVLFLPGATVSAAGSSAVHSWILASALCLFLIPLFAFMLQYADCGRGISGLLELGLGKRISRGISILVLGTVCFGMPASALIAEEFLARQFSLFPGAPTLIASMIIIVPVAINLLGQTTSARVQATATFGVVAVAIAVLYSSSGRTIDIPSTSQAPTAGALTGALLAFWAFAGFENLVFMASEFRNPKRDIPIAMTISIMLCGTIYGWLTLNYSILILPEQVDTKLGLLQLASRVPESRFLAPTTAIFAAIALFVNFNSWFRGVARLAATSAADGTLPKALSFESKTGTPLLALVFLAVIQLTTVQILGYSKPAFEWAIKQVSLNFAFIYVLIFASAATFMARHHRRVSTGFIATAIVAVLLALLILHEGLLVLYPIALLALPIAVFRRNGESA